MLAAFYCIIVAAIRREAPFGPVLTHFDEAAVPESLTAERRNNAQDNHPQKKADQNVDGNEFARDVRIVWHSRSSDPPL